MSIDPLLPPDKDKYCQNDPMNIIRSEFDIYGKGLSGNYRHNTVTRIGFIILGIPLLIMGIGSFVVTIFCLISRDWKLMSLSIVIGLWSGISLVSGFLLVKNAVKKKNRNK
jgi:hypothetical protein